MGNRDEGRENDMELAAAFRQLFDTVSNWGRWGADDERGALNYLTPARVLEASRVVCTGETLTMSLPLSTKPGIDNPAPADHYMTMITDKDIGSGTLRFAKDYVGADYHNPSHTHLDAFCHVAFDGNLYNGRPAASLGRGGATADDIEVLKNGLVGRGVLLDVPALRGVQRLEPGDHIWPSELERCEQEQGVTVTGGRHPPHPHRHWAAPRRPRTLGHRRRQGRPPPHLCQIFGGAPGLCTRIGWQQRHHPEHDRGHRLSDTCLGAERDGNSTSSTICSSKPSPPRANEKAAGVPFLASPLRIAGGTGSPVNPIAIL